MVGILGLDQWAECPTCSRLMHPEAKTCGNYCRWDELVVEPRDSVPCQCWHDHGSCHTNCRKAG